MTTWTTNQPASQDFLTPDEVSDLLRVSVYSVRRWIKAGELPAYKVGRMWRIGKTELDAWLTQCKLSDQDDSD